MPFETAHVTNNPTPPSTTATTKVQHSLGHRPPPHAEPLHCPRCDSNNTKFCYYNNYNLAQPRYFCKSCRRYWTHGGTLRNVPVGGGSRKNTAKRARSSNSSSSGSPSSSSLTQEVSSVVPTSSAPAPTPAKPISLFAGSMPETASDHDQMMDLNENVVVNGGFTSLLSCQGPPPPAGFLALGGYGCGYGSGLGNDQVGTFGYGGGLGRGVWAFPEVGDFSSTVNDGNNNDASGGSNVSNTWQMMNGADGGLVDGNCYAWPELENSMMPAAGKCFK